MNPSKLKQIAILLLVCINLTLAGNLLYARAITTLVPKKTIADTMTFLERCGIWAEDGVIPRREHAVYALSAARSPEKETAVAQALIGSGDRIEQGGGIGRYESPDGEAIFRRGGLINVTIWRQDVPTTGAEAQKKARTLLKKAGILPEKSGVVVETGQTPEQGVTVRFYAERNGFRLRNAALEVAFQAGETRISGCALTNEAVQTAQQSRNVTALLADFGAYATAYHIDVTLIAAVERVYFHTVGDDGSARMIPALAIKTDHGDYLINGLDGSVLSAA